MSVTQNPIIGRARQKLGGIVFTTWKGINVIKGKPLTVANPKSDGQLMRRSALTLIVEVGRQISAAINLGFKEQAVGKSAFNAFTGLNLRNAFNYSAPPAATLNVDKLQVAQGTIATNDVAISASSAGADTVTATWTSGTLSPGQSMSDLAYMVVANAAKDRFYVSPVTALRSANTLVASVPNGFFAAAEQCFAYVFFYNSTSRKSSDSVYDGFIVGA